MQLSALIEALSNPAVYSYPVGQVQVRQTHISAVFLAGDYVYKIKKPVELGFLNFSTLDRRRHFCEEEVRLNRRLAPQVYLGVVPVTRSDEGIRIEGQGEVIEWAVKMRRLPDEATLQQRLRRDEITVAQVEALAGTVATFHASAMGGESVAAFGRFDVVARNARENFEQAQSHVGLTVSQAVFERLQGLTAEALARLRPLIEARAERGVPRDTHGDLHLDHVYLFPDRPPPDDVVIIDCIEFNERFRFADPVADMAFLVMDFVFHGRRDLARTFADANFQVSGDAEGRVLLPFYTAYRAAVRGKVEGFKAAESEVPEADRAKAIGKARAHWLVALGELEQPARKPCLVLVGGLQGTGKSTLARLLAETAGFEVFRTDVIRKELAVQAGVEPVSTTFEQGVYGPEWTERTYAECLRRAEACVFEGQRAMLDASFRQERYRVLCLDAARRWGVPAVFLLCRAEPGSVRERLANRRDDASDADWAIHQEAAAHWEAAGPLTRAALYEIATDAPVDEVRDRALAFLHGRGLA